MTRFLARYLKRKSFVLLVISLSVNITLGVWIWKSTAVSPASSIERPQDYPLLSPRIFSERKNDILINFWPLRQQLRAKARTYGKDFGFYFEYLPTGVTIGVNEKDEFAAGSLIKLPVAIAYLYGQERTGLATEPLPVTIQKQDLDSNFGSLWQRGEGTKIDLDKAMELALVESDNTAVNVLKNHVSEDDFTRVYEGLDIERYEQNGQVFISSKSYASIFKALYFSSLVSKVSSQRILDLLTKTRFSDKLASPLPREIAVAHKIGIIANEEIYRDCGIVYVPKRPYILCMMSRSTEDVARMRMSTVSQMIFEYMAQINTKE